LPSEPLWPEPAEVIAVNRAVVSDTGEPFALLDEGRLLSALGSPRNHYAYGERDAVTLAVVLLAAIARNHPFMQGNKRTAFAVALGFLERCGYAFRTRDSRSLADAITAVIEHQMSDTDFEALVRPFVFPLEPPPT
jgi:death on curing protein